MSSIGPWSGPCSTEPRPSFNQLIPKTSQHDPVIDITHSHPLYELKSNEERNGSAGALHEVR